jgi:glycosyltransferase involved in cell wall biosynthesis
VLVESNIIQNKKLLYVPNGILENDAKIDDKEHTILYVGYIEKKNKSIDMLINAISNINLNDWKLVLIGSIQEDMKEFIEELFINKPELESKIIFKGYITDKDVLAKEYAKSSIYCCTSKKESFGISTLEAAYYGNYIISTDVGGSPDIIQETGYGRIIQHDRKVLENTLQDTINNWDNIKDNPEHVQKKINATFNWNNICNKIINKLK